MTTAPHSPAPPASRFLWALRFYVRPLTAAAFVTLFLTSVAFGRIVVAPPSFTATAAVIATNLEFSAERVPRLAEAVFQQDSVLDEALQSGRLPWSIDELRDDHADVTPLEDNVLITVEGIAPTAELAVRTANSVAEALAGGLQRSGTEATFTVQDRAERAEQDPVLLPVILTLVAGLLGATAVVLGLAALLLALCRPVTRPSEAAMATGVRVLTVVDVPRRGTAFLPLPGLEALQRTMDERGGRLVLMTSTFDAAPLRTAVAESYAYLLSLSRDTTFVGSDSARQADSSVLAGSRVVAHARTDVLMPAAGTTVVDGFDDEGAAWRVSLPAGSLGVVVVAEGTRQDRIVPELERLDPDDLAGVVFVARQGSRRRHRKRRARYTAPTRWADRTGALQPGRAPAVEAGPSSAASPGA